MTQIGFEQPLTRRHVLATGVAAAVTVLAGCGSSGQQTSGQQGSGWTFVDDRKHTIRLKQRPTGIVAYATAAAALYDWGVTPVGVFGVDPREDPLLARLPWDRVQVVGSVYGEINLQDLRSLKADLIVSRWYPPPANVPLFGFKNLAQQKMIGSQVPIAGIDSHVVATREIERFGDLARALGVNTRSGRIARARADFVRAENRLSQIARGHSNLRIIAVSGDQSTMYVAKVPDSSDLSLYAARGVPLVSAHSSDPYWDSLPWRKAATYPADGILYDARHYALPLADAKAIQTFAQLPAVRAQQVGGWQADAPPSYQTYTKTMNDLAKTIAGWHKVL
jgi:iron complex transport system substrate-binding protein